MTVIKLTLPLQDKDLDSLKTGDKFLLSGVVYTARDAAHKRIVEYLHSGKELPFDLKGAVIFYAGPAPTKPGQICGVIGPTTSARMDKYTPRLLDAGVKVLIGKGERSREVEQAVREHKAAYFVAVGGAAALLSKTVVSCKLVAFEDLGPEAICRLEVRDFPCYAAIV